MAFADREPHAPTLTEVVGRMIDRTWGVPTPAAHAALKRATERVVVDEPIRLGSDPRATVESRAAAEWGLRRIAGLLRARGQAGGGLDAEAHRALAAADIERFLQRRAAPTPAAEPPGAPAGMPIGNRERRR